MRLSVMLAGLTFSLAWITASSGATTWNVLSVSPRATASAPAVVAEVTKNGVVPEHHPLYHHYKHRYGTPNKLKSGRRR